MKKPLILAAAFVLLAGLAIWWYSPSQVLKRRTVVLLEAMTLEPGTTKTSRQMGLYTVSALLAEQVTLVSSTHENANGDFPKQEVESAYSWFCERVRESRFANPAFESVTVTGADAEVIVTVDALVDLDGSRPVDGPYRVSLRWHNPDGHWLLARAEWERK